MKKTSTAPRSSAGSEQKDTKWTKVGGRINVAGVQYSQYELIRSALRLGMVLELYGEPSNPFDSHAVKVMYAGYCLGYIPARTIEQSECWRAHKEGYKLMAVITGHDITMPNWCKLTVQIYTCKNKQEEPPIKF